MNVSLCWDDLSDLERPVFSKRGLGPGSKLYIRKRRPLDDATLVSKFKELRARGVNEPAAIEAIAREFGRDGKTIADRLSRLRARDSEAEGGMSS